mmetsp:Transcript_2889/g.3561  ORF Transcript_2889/g.3561 Transcript_2889/m.3561 type:complete len:105 (+) Transcript_2889:3-317(+)
MEYLAKELADKEVSKGKLSHRIVIVLNADLLKEHSEVIVNSIGNDVKNGFGGVIGKCILKETGDKIVEEAVKEAQNKFKSTKLKEGEFVSTSAGKSKNHSYIIH